MKLVHIVNRLMKPMAITATAHASLMMVVNRHINDGPMLEDGDDLEELFGGVDEPFDMDSNVRVIPISGPIGYKVSNLERVCGIADIGLIRQWTEEAMADDNINTILYNIDSPGGEITQIFETADFIAECGKKKHTVAFTDTLAASAAYALAAACNEIFATPSSDVGSIGVYSYLLDMSKMYENEGVKVEKFVSGDLKGIGIPGVPLTDTQRQYMQAEVEKMGTMFREYIKERRPKVEDKSMRGQTISGAEATEAGLIDHCFGSFNEILS
jgi:signal peptide peptidase SppA